MYITLTYLGQVAAVNGIDYHLLCVEYLVRTGRRDMHTQRYSHTHHKLYTRTLTHTYVQYIHTHHTHTCVQLTHTLMHTIAHT